MRVTGLSPAMPSSNGLPEGFEWLPAERGRTRGEERGCSAFFALVFAFNVD